ncbi:MAG: hypothetical protein LUD69_07250 [Oscillospiraceae bacterium]|nr:hypothetical protein [Oscillospiraceae bacterium]
MRIKDIIRSFVGTDKIVLEDAYQDAKTNAAVISGPGRGFALRQNRTEQTAAPCNDFAQEQH